jgi:hypothetical protein
MWIRGKVLHMALLISIAACADQGPSPVSVAGQYLLTSVDKTGLPCCERVGALYFYGALTVRLNGTWEELDTVAADLSSARQPLRDFGSYHIRDGIVTFLSEAPGGSDGTGLPDVPDGKSLTIVRALPMRYERQ